MEHRTLKQQQHGDNTPRTVKTVAAHFRNWKNVQTTAQTVESMFKHLNLLVSLFISFNQYFR